jgi:GDP-L-fucose synthase
MPTNLYGPGDNYELNDSHVLPALIRKAHEAKASNHAEMVVWGTGASRREFLYSDDMANACIRLMQLPDAQFDALINPAPADWSQPPLINIGCGEELTIRELAALVVDIVGFKGNLAFDGGKPDGAPRKLLDISKMQALGWRPKIRLREGIALAYRDYQR